MMVNPLLPGWLLAIVLTLLVLFFISLEIKRHLRFKVLRVVAVIIMMLGVAGILFRPQYESKAGDQILLLTRGYDKKLADSLVSAEGIDAYYFTGAQSYRQGTKLVSLHGLPAGKRVGYVAGEGLPDYDASQLAASITFFPSKVTNGVGSIYLPSVARRNAKSTVQGIYNTSNDNTKIYLESPAGKVDSMQIKSGINKFSLSFTPRTNGRAIYKITSSDGKTSEKLPLNIVDSDPLKVLVLQGYPTFELQYLKNFLADRGHHLALRYQLSRNIYRTEFVNQKSVSLKSLTPALLNDFDLVLTDTESIAKLSASERKTIELAARSGLGVLTLMSVLPSKLKSDVLPFEFRRINEDTTTLALGGKSYALPASALRPITNTALEPVTTNRTGTLSGYMYLRRGKVGFQLLQETYQLILSGDSINYGRIWSPLIDNIARSRERAASIAIANHGPVYADEPITIGITSYNQEPHVFADGVRLPVMEDEAIDGLWNARLWADHPGWHNITTQDDTLHYYVLEDNDWAGVRATDRINATTLIAQGKTDSSNTKTTRRDYPPIYFYLMFILGGGFLWLAPKL